jgi:hypothetical protein
LDYFFLRPLINCTGYIMSNARLIVNDELDRRGSTLFESTIPPLTWKH